MKNSLIRKLITILDKIKNIDSSKAVESNVNYVIEVLNLEMARNGIARHSKQLTINNQKEVLK